MEEEGSKFESWVGVALITYLVVRQMKQNLLPLQTNN
jgi:cytochrome b